MKIRAQLLREYGPISPPEYMVDKVVELSSRQFASFLERSLDQHDFIKDNHVPICQSDGIEHCLLALSEGGGDGVLIQCGDDGRASYAAYVAGARDVVQARLDQAVSHIVQQGTEYTASGYWCIYCEELEEQLGVTIHDGSGLDTMLKDALERRPEVESVNMVSEAIETTFRPEFCKGLNSNTEEKALDIRVRDILPLLIGGGLPTHSGGPGRSFFTHPETDVRVWPDALLDLTPYGQKDHAALLDARIAQLRPSSEGLEVVLTDVEPGELTRFNAGYDALQRAKQAMGPTM